MSTARGRPEALTFEFCQDLWVRIEFLRFQHAGPDGRIASIRACGDDALKSIGQELSEAVAIAEKTGAGKAISGGLVKERDRVNFVVIVLSDGRVKEVLLKPPRPLSKARPTAARGN